MRAAIIIPARLQSTRLPNKMLLAETGHPLICHTARTAARIRDMSGGLFTEVLVAVDDPSLADAVKRYSDSQGIDVRAVMTDPTHQSGSDRIAEAMADLPADIDSILNFQGDEPELPVKAALALARFYQDTRTDIATIVYPVIGTADRENPDLVKAVLGCDGRALYFSRSDIPYRRENGAFSPPSYGHIGIYLYRRASLERFVSLPPGALEQTEKLEQLRAIENGMTITAMILDERLPKGIDTREDYDSFVARFSQEDPEVEEAP